MCILGLRDHVVGTGLDREVVRQDRHGRPLDAVNVAKQELIERGANSWLYLLGTRSIPWRFDVVEVILSDGEVPEVTVVNDVF